MKQKAIYPPNYPPKKQKPATDAGFKAILAERALQSSNLALMNELKTNGLQNMVSPHKLAEQPELPFMDALLRDIIAINDFLVGVEAEPLLMPEKGENRKRVAFKKVEAA